jgi:ribosomal protein S18 acetylase RimI-like enzyme
MEKYGSKEEKIPSITLERATAKDAAIFLEIEMSILSTSTYSSTADLHESLEEIENNIIYLIHEGDHIVGSVMYEMKTPDHAYISGLTIRPDFQGRGLGKTAMEKVLKELKDIPTVDLVTHPDNARAIKLYTSLGFTIGERIENYFDDGQSRIVMTLKRQN